MKEKEIKVQSSRRGEIEATQQSSCGAGRLQSRNRESDQAEQAKRRNGRKENSKVKSKGGKRTQHLNRARTQKSRQTKGKKSRAGGSAKRNRKHAQELKYATVQTN